MELDFTITKQDYLDALKLQWRGSPAARIVNTLALVLVVLWLLASGMFGFRHGFFFLVPLACFLAFAWIFKSMVLPTKVMKVYRKQKEHHRFIRYSISDDGLKMTTPGVKKKTDPEDAPVPPDREVAIPWDAFEKWRENDRTILVYQKERLFNMFPKRVFTNPVDIDRFREMLTRRLGYAEK